MPVYAEAMALVNLLLETDITVKWRGAHVQVPAVALKHVQQWTSFITVDAHGVAQFAARVENDDLEEFYKSMARLTRATAKGQVLVPASGEWALKMPGGYAIFGTGSEGVTCAGRRRAIAADQQLTENAAMTPLENRQWEAARRGL